MSTSELRAGAPGRLTLSGRALRVSFSEETLIVDLEDGRQLAVPLAWFPRLMASRKRERLNWELIGGGVGVHWPDLDEDISVENLLGAHGDLLTYQPSMRPEDPDSTPFKKDRATRSRISITHAVGSELTRRPPTP